MTLWATLVVAALAIPVTVLICTTAVLIVRSLKGDRTAHGRKLDEEEARTMQEIFQGLEKMEKRVEALETLLLDLEGKAEHGTQG